MENREKLGRVVQPALLLLAFLALRLPNLGRFATADEALWLRNSADFYYAVMHADWQATFLSSHPGITTLWAGFLGFLMRFPEYRDVGESAISDFGLRHLLLNRGVNPVEVLAAGRAAVVIFAAMAFIASWFYARRLLGVRAAMIGMALFAFDPFLIAHQRLLHQDGLLTSFMLLAMLAFLDYLRAGRWSALIVAGVATGLSGLTKTPGWFVVPVIAGLAFWHWVRQRKTGATETQKRIPSIALFGIVILATWALLFPAMWRIPMEVLDGVLDYTLVSAQGGYSGPVFFNGMVYPLGDLGKASIIFYPLSFLWRSTPLVLAGLGFAGWLLLRKIPETRHHDAIVGLFLFALFFGLLMSLGVKKFDRYLLPAHGPLILIAGWGWSRIAEAWQKKSPKQPDWAANGVLALVLGLQFASAWTSAPYFLSYYNPSMGGNAKAPETMMVGWGEGLDKAASYLNMQPGIGDAKVASWYSSSFNLLFAHDAAHILIVDALPDDELQALLGMDYLVVYIHQWQRGTPANLLEILSREEPVFIAGMDGLEYARVYRLGNP